MRRETGTGISWVGGGCRVRRWESCSTSRKRTESSLGSSKRSVRGGWRRYFASSPCSTSEKRTESSLGSSKRSARGGRRRHLAYLLNTTSAALDRTIIEVLLPMPMALSLGDPPVVYETKQHRCFRLVGPDKNFCRDLDPCWSE